MALFDFFGSKKPPREVREALGRIRSLMTSDEEQNQFLTPLWKPRFPNAVDSWPDARGEFGRSMQNPIPVNGPVGEIIYLSQLRTENGLPLMFHRLGSAGDRVDIFELVSLDGTHWDVLYLDLYSIRKSRLTPAGLKRCMKLDDDYPFIFGTHTIVKDFPYGLPDALKTAFTSKIPLPWKPSLFVNAMSKTSFARPEAHRRKLDA